MTIIQPLRELALAKINLLPLVQDNIIQVADIEFNKLIFRSMYLLQRKFALIGMLSHHIADPIHLDLWLNREEKFQQHKRGEKLLVCHVLFRNLFGDILDYVFFAKKFESGELLYCELVFVSIPSLFQDLIKDILPDNLANNFPQFFHFYSL
jgi:hypothetical protein